VAAARLPAKAIHNSARQTVRGEIIKAREPARLRGLLAVPVIFHGTGSSRLWNLEFVRTNIDLLVSPNTERITDVANSRTVRTASESITVSPIAGALGAEVNGVDLSKQLDNSIFNEIHQALLDHQVLFFHDQNLTPQQQASFARRFGPLNRHPYVKPLKGAPDVFAIIKEPGDRHHFGNGWHTDLSYAEKPAMGAMLYGVEVPPYGGDTLFTNLCLAYDAMSDGMKSMLDGMKAVFSNARTYGPDAQRFRDGVKAMSVAQQADTSRVVHPIVRTHPETGRKSLFVNELHTIGIEDMTDEEARPLLDHLNKHITNPEFTCRFHWRQGSLAFWDNRCTAHYAINDFDGMRRVMHRVTIEGDRPF
jgi:taurine dioxygenase